MPPRTTDRMLEDLLEKVDILEDLLEKVDLLLKVTALQVGVGKSVTERARLLKMAGLDNQTIAAVLNTSPAAVRTLTSNLRIRRR